MKEIPSLMLDFLHFSDNLPGLSQRTHLWIEEVSGRGIFLPMTRVDQLVALITEEECLQNNQGID